MPNSQVPKVGLKQDGSIVLTVQVVGWTEGKSVEISGYVTQDAGVYVSFHDIRTIPEADPEGVAKLEVTVPSEALKLIPRENVRVLTWVSEVWPSVLIEDTPTGEFLAAWKIQDAWG